MLGPVYFYPHKYLRDRQLDTIRHWPSNEVVNPELASTRIGGQVALEAALSAALPVSWKGWIPLMNLKFRPRDLPPKTIVYVWGGLMLSGPFVVDLDNPYVLTGYNLGATSLYRPLLKLLLLDERCRQIRCMSNACRENLRVLYGQECWRKAQVYYPRLAPPRKASIRATGNGCRFLFVSTQFEIKGGVALLKAFRRVHAEEPSIHLDLVTHLPPEYAHLASGMGITVHPANIPRATLVERFLETSDVLIHPTYVDSFGMVLLEAMAHGLALIATDVYATSEMVVNGVNGFLLRAPISIWNGVVPSRHYYALADIKASVRRTSTDEFEEQLATSILTLARDARLRRAFREASRHRFATVFSQQGVCGV